MAPHKDVTEELRQPIAHEDRIQPFELGLDRKQQSERTGSLTGKLTGDLEPDDGYLGEQ